MRSRKRRRHRGLHAGRLFTGWTAGTSTRRPAWRSAERTGRERGLWTAWAGTPFAASALPTHHGDIHHGWGHFFNDVHEPLGQNRRWRRVTTAAGATCER